MKGSTNKLSAHLGLLIFCLFVALPAQAMNIDVFSTGVDASGMPLTPGTMDSHWLVDGNPTYAADAGLGFPTWAQQNTAGASWIATTPNVPYIDNIASFVYMQTFDLTGLDLSTVVFNGLLSTDDGGELFLNGVSTGLLTPTNQWALPAVVFDLTGANFIAGVNTLSVRVDNIGGPTGLFLEITEATAAPIPEPSTILLFGSGLAGLAAWRYRKK